MAGDRKLLDEFVAEAKEHLADLTDDLLSLERLADEAARERLDRLFRAVHSVKGGAGYVGCKPVERLAHAMETVLDGCRDRCERPTAVALDALLAGSDRILALLDDIDHVADLDISGPLDRLQAVIPVPAAPVKPAVALVPIFPLPSGEPPLGQRGERQPFLIGVRLDLEACYRRERVTPLDVVRRLEQLGTILDARLDLPPGDLEQPVTSEPLIYLALVASAHPTVEFARCLGLAEADLVTLEAAEPEPPRPSRPAPPPAAVAATPSIEKPTTLRIPVGLVDRLMTLAGELVLVRNQAARTVDSADPALRPIVQRLDAVTVELQEAVMRTRMQPVSHLFNRFPRLVRDLARQLGKEITLELRGSDVELDKTVLEALADPLTHLVRNCCDHGIERPDIRERLGKSATGTITLSARHHDGQITIEVRDDGRGIDPEAVRRKALQLGLRSSGELSRLSESDLVNLILLPGFSTADQVSDLSGRGVGMDVVRTNIEQLSGALELASRPGRGMTITLRLPLTLAIIPCLMVTSGGQTYALPQKDIEELVGLLPGQGRARLEIAHDQEVIRLRDRLLPLVRLDEVFRRRAPFTSDTRASIARTHHASAASDHPQFFAVIKAGPRRFGLMVDAILTTEEVVIKPMPEALQRLGCFTGATILGDGRVALILSAEGIARHAGVTGTETVLPAPPSDTSERQAVLLFESGSSEQFAVPLAMVRRIQPVRAAEIEHVGREEIVAVDGVPVPVLRLEQVLSVSPCREQDDYYLILPKNARRLVGVLASRLIDTDALSVSVHLEAVRGAGLVGSALVRGRTTLFLDLYRLADLGTPPAGEPTPRSHRGRVLLVEDTQFFRQLVRGYLEAAGFDVTTAENGVEGLARLDQGVGFDLVVSDIEMPVMDGWSFARAIRRRAEGRELPLMALTTLNSSADRDRASECGFDRYEVKIDRERFLATLESLLRERGRA